MGRRRYFTFHKSSGASLSYDLILNQWKRGCPTLLQRCSHHILLCQPFLIWWKTDITFSYCPPHSQILWLRWIFSLATGSYGLGLINKEEAAYILPKTCWLKSIETGFIISFFLNWHWHIKVWFGLLGFMAYQPL